jgi:hypothetical protein
MTGKVDGGFKCISGDDNDLHKNKLLQENSKTKVLKIVTENGIKTLKVVDLKEETTFFERVAAWFGFGAISLKNIIYHLKENSVKVDPKLELKFYEAIYNKALKIKSIKTSDLNFISSHIQYHRTESLGAEVSCTYAGSPEGILDFSYKDTRSGYGFVFDGTGHGNPKMHSPYNELLGDFIADYNEALDFALNRHPPFKSPEEARVFVRDQIKQFHLFIEEEALEFDEEIASFGGAISFAQVLKISGKTCAIISNCGDSKTVIFNKTTGKLTSPVVANRLALGGVLNNYIDKKIDEYTKIVELQEGDEIIGLTDGVLDFLTKSEIETILIEGFDKGKSSKEILLQLEEKIRSKGIEKTNRILEVTKDKKNKLINNYFLEIAAAQIANFCTGNRCDPEKLKDLIREGKVLEFIKGENDSNIKKFVMGVICLGLASKEEHLIVPSVFDQLSKLFEANSLLQDWNDEKLKDTINKFTAIFQSDKFQEEVPDFVVFLEVLSRRTEVLSGEEVSMNESEKGKIKYHYPDKKDFCDDISIFHMHVKP